MYTIIILTVILSSVGIYLIKKRFNYIELDGYLIIVMTILFVSFIFTLLLTLNKNYYEYYVSKSMELVSMNDTQGVNGSFFIGSGIISNEQVFSFYYKDGEKYRRESIPADRSVIIYTNSNPKVEVIKKRPKENIENWVLTPEAVIEYRISIPKGSIKEEILLDNN